jgi:hypothetical protein
MGFGLVLAVIGLVLLVWPRPIVAYVKLTSGGFTGLSLNAPHAGRRRFTAWNSPRAGSVAAFSSAGSAWRWRCPNGTFGVGNRVDVQQAECVHCGDHDCLLIARL